MRACISIGSYATTPYYFSGLDVSVYCVEELCFLFHESSMLLDQSIMVRPLVKWIETECDLPDLANSLYPLVQRQGSLSNFVGMIMEYTGLYDDYAIQDVRAELKKGAGLSTIERHKNQVDYLVSKKNYFQAIRGYKSLIEKWNTVDRDKSSLLPGLNVLGNIYHNLGVAYAGMMLYEKAMEAFERAWEVDGNPEHFQAFMAAARMYMREDEYLSFVTTIPDSHDKALKLERVFDRLRNEWNYTAEARHLEQRNTWRDEGETAKYYADNEQILWALTDGYRNSVGE